MRVPIWVQRSGESSLRFDRRRSAPTLAVTVAATMSTTPEVDDLTAQAAALEVADADAPTTDRARVCLLNMCGRACTRPLLSST